MAGYLTDPVNNQVLDALFGGGELPRCETLYFGLSLLGVSRAGFVREPEGGGYARVALPNDERTFPAAIGGRKANAVPIRFSTPIGDWGWINGLFVADAAAEGRVLAIADIDPPVWVGFGRPAPELKIGALTLAHL